MNETQMDDIIDLMRQNARLKEELDDLKSEFKNHKANSKYNAEHLIATRDKLIHWIDEWKGALPKAAQDSLKKIRGEK